MESDLKPKLHVIGKEMIALVCVWLLRKGHFPSGGGYWWASDTPGDNSSMYFGADTNGLREL